MCVSLCVYPCEPVSTCIWVPMGVCVGVFNVSLCVYLCLYGSVSLCLSVYVYLVCSCVLSADICPCMFVIMCLCVCLPVYECVCLCVYVEE